MLRAPPRQTEDKVFSLRQRKRNAGRLVDRVLVGVYGYVRGRDRLKAMTAGVTGFPVSPVSLIFGETEPAYDVMLLLSFQLVIAVLPSLSSLCAGSIFGLSLAALLFVLLCVCAFVFGSVLIFVLFAALISVLFLFVHNVLLFISYCFVRPYSFRGGGRLFLTLRIYAIYILNVDIANFVWYYNCVEIYIRSIVIWRSKETINISFSALFPLFR